jgi:hypothetical protein
LFDFMDIIGVSEPHVVDIRLWTVWLFVDEIFLFCPGSFETERNLLNNHEELLLGVLSIVGPAIREWKLDGFIGTLKFEIAVRPIS